MLDTELLEMKLNDVSDLLLEHLGETGKDVAYFEIDGCSVKSRRRMRLTVSLSYLDDGEDK